MAKTEDQFNDMPDVMDDDGSDAADTNTGDDGDEAVNLEALLNGMSDDGDSDDSDDDSDDDSEDTSGKDPEADPEMEAIIQQRVTEQLNRLIPERLKRDRKTQQVNELEQLTGMSLDDIRKQIIKNAVTEKAFDLGISEEEAELIVAQEHENAGYKAEKVTRQQEEADISAAMQQVNYLNSKSKFMTNPKYSRIIKGIEAEVDAFTQNGTLLSFEDGAQYVLGQKVLKGSLLDSMATGAENRAKANIAKRGKATPQTKSTGSKSTTTSLSQDQRQFAAFMKVSEADYAAELAQLKKSKRR